MQIIYSGNMSELSNLPFHVLLNNHTIIFKRHVLDFICNNNKELFTEFFNTPLSEYEIDIEGETSYPLLVFVNHANDVNCDSFEKDRNTISEKERELYKKLHPLTMALAKIGAKKIFNEFEENETPMVVFEKELITQAWT